MKERTFKKMIFAVFCCQFLSIPLFAQQQKVDTTHTYSIPEITVSDIYQTREVRSTAPLQAQFENLGELVKNTIFVA
jgi:vitamin B12 transporter